MFDDYNSVEEKVRDLASKAGELIMKNRSPEEAERLVDIFVKVALESMEEFAEFDVY